MPSSGVHAYMQVEHYIINESLKKEKIAFKIIMFLLRFIYFDLMYIGVLPVYVSVYHEHAMPVEAGRGAISPV